MEILHWDAIWELSEDLNLVNSCLFLIVSIGPFALAHLRCWEEAQDLVKARISDLDSMLHTDNVREKNAIKFFRPYLIQNDLIIMNEAILLQNDQNFVCQCVNTSWKVWSKQIRACLKKKVQKLVKLKEQLYFRTRKVQLTLIVRRFSCIVGSMRKRRGCVRRPLFLGSYSCYK